VYTDLLLGLAGRQQPVLRPSKGMHLVFRSEATRGKALVLPVGGNVLYFLVPFRPGYLAMGCTDTDYPADSYGRLDRVPTTEEEVHFTLGLLERVMPGAFGTDQVLACYAGVRPLLAPPGNRSLSESATSRTHRIWQAHGGIWAVAGGKYTTFRLMASSWSTGWRPALRSRAGLYDGPANYRLRHPDGGFEAWSGERPGSRRACQRLYRHWPRYHRRRRGGGAGSGDPRWADLPQAAFYKGESATPRSGRCAAARPTSWCAAPSCVSWSTRAWTRWTRSWRVWAPAWAGARSCGAGRPRTTATTSAR
jgi:glycerol-3-phosphate dehydrogenase